MAWEFDRGDWQIWRGPVGGGMPVPTLAEQGSLNGIVQVSGDAVLLTDGTVVRPGGHTPPGTAVRISRSYTDYTAPMFGLTATGGLVDIALDGTVTPHTPMPAGKTIVAVGPFLMLASDGTMYGEVSTGGATQYPNITDSISVSGARREQNSYYIASDGDAKEAGTGSVVAHDIAYAATTFGCAVYIQRDHAVVVVANDPADVASLTPPAGAVYTKVSMQRMWAPEDVQAVYVTAAKETVTRATRNDPARVPEAALPTSWSGRVEALTSPAYWSNQEFFSYLRDDGHVLRNGGAASVPKAALVGHAVARDAFNNAEVEISYTLAPPTGVGVPWEINWGDGTANTPVPKGTAAGTKFTHTYADDVDHTVTVVVPGTTLAVDTVVAHRDPMNLGVQYVFAYDAATQQFKAGLLKVEDSFAGTGWHDGEINVYKQGVWVN